MGQRGSLAAHVIRIVAHTKSRTACSKPGTPLMSSSRCGASVVQNWRKLHVSSSEPSVVMEVMSSISSTRSGTRYMHEM